MSLGHLPFSMEPPAPTGAEAAFETARYQLHMATRRKYRHGYGTDEFFDAEGDELKRALEVVDREWKMGGRNDEDKSAMMWKEIQMLSGGVQQQQQQQPLTAATPNNGAGGGGDVDNEAKHQRYVENVMRYHGRRSWLLRRMEENVHARFRREKRREVLDLIIKSERKNDTCTFSGCGSVDHQAAAIRSSTLQSILFALRHTHKNTLPPFRFALAKTYQYLPQSLHAPYSQRSGNVYLPQLYKEEVVALVPRSLGEKMMVYIFGADAKREIITEMNGLWLREEYAKEFVRGNMAFVPDYEALPRRTPETDREDRVNLEDVEDASEGESQYGEDDLLAETNRFRRPREWKIMVLNYEKDSPREHRWKWIAADAHNESHGLHRRHQPRTRYFYFRYLVAMVQAGRQRRWRSEDRSRSNGQSVENADADADVDADDGDGSCKEESAFDQLWRVKWPRGRYISEDFIRALIEEYDDVIPSETQVEMLKHAFAVGEGEGDGECRKRELAAAIRGMDEESDDEYLDKSGSKSERDPLYYPGDDKGGDGGLW